MLIYKVMSHFYNSQTAVGGRVFSLIYLMLPKTDQKDHPCQHLEY